MKMVSAITILAGLSLAVPLQGFAVDRGGIPAGRGGGAAVHAPGGGRPQGAAHFSTPAGHSTFTAPRAGGGNFHAASVPRGNFQAPRTATQPARVNPIAGARFTGNNFHSNAGRSNVAYPRGGTFANQRPGNTAVTTRNSGFRNANGIVAGRNGQYARGTGRTYNANAYTANQNRYAYNRGNNYGGRWVAANVHPNWNHNRSYYLNHHNYRWYDGGWLIVDGGFWPGAYPYYGYDYGYASYDTVPYVGSYAGTGSTVTDVQARLAQLGYYQGLVDGDIGPMTRQAIAAYQSDNGLLVTGRINDALLQSLALE